jgi:predicted SnoaL-like aldol condensation-catalyzing enzyme
MNAIRCNGIARKGGAGVKERPRSENGVSRLLAPVVDMWRLENNKIVEHWM